MREDSYEIVVIRAEDGNEYFVPIPTICKEMGRFEIDFENLRYRKPKNERKER